MSGSQDKALLDKAWNAVRAAVAKYNEGKPVDEVCPFCSEPLIVEGFPPGGPYTQWQIRCPCGKCTTTLKGL